MRSFDHHVTHDIVAMMCACVDEQNMDISNPVSYTINIEAEKRIDWKKIIDTRMEAKVFVQIL